MAVSKKKTLYREGALYVPFLNEGERVMTNGLRKDVSRHGNGSEHSKKDITKSVKRPKNRAVQNFNNRVNAQRKNEIQGKVWDKAQTQFPIHERANYDDPIKYFRQAEQKASREAKKKLKAQ